MEQTRASGAQTIAVVLPCYKSKQHVLDVIARIGRETALIIAVDDACPMGTGAHIEQSCRDPRLVVVRNQTNLGVGGAVMHGYRVALEKGADIVVKIDSDGQMDPALLPTIVMLAPASWTFTGNVRPGGIIRQGHPLMRFGTRP